MRHFSLSSDRTTDWRSWQLGDVQGRWVRCTGAIAFDRKTNFFGL